jgi:hypothetical protein
MKSKPYIYFKRIKIKLIERSLTNSERVFFCFILPIIILCMLSSLVSHIKLHGVLFAEEYSWDLPRFPNAA